MQEYNDGSFGRIKKGSDLLKELADNPDEMARTKAVHFGTEEELEAKKLSSGQAKRIMDKLEQLERKINRVIVALKIDIPGEILVVD